MTARLDAPPTETVHADSHRIVEEMLSRYGTIARRALLATLPSKEPRRHLYDLVPDYPVRGGKMLRSSICLSTCCAFGGGIEDALDSAVAIELLHSAFLVHDDVEDGSAMRRGRPTLHVDHGIPTAVNLGDALSLLSMKPLMRNLSVLGPGLGQRILVEMQQVAQRAVEGQAQELGWRIDNADAVTDRDYLGMVLNKTCWYTSIFPCRVGAMIGARQHLAPDFAVRFGFFLGAVFQIRDDILSVAGSAEHHGKTEGDDILEGKRTLLLIHLMENLDLRERGRLMQILGLSRELREPEQVCWIVERMRRCGSIDFANEYACALAGAALWEFENTFGELPESENKQFLRNLIWYMVERDE